MVVMLLEDEPSLKSEVKSALTLVFNVSLNSPLVPNAENHPQRMMLPTPCHTMRMVLFKCVEPDFLRFQY